MKTNFCEESSELDAIRPVIRKLAPRTKDK